MTTNVKKNANRFIRKHKLTNINYSKLKNTVCNMGYTVIEFSRDCNDKDVATVIENLNLYEAISVSMGFTYVSKDYRLVFVNENLNEEEKLLVLSHEVGHIVCEHFSTASIIGNDVRDEYEANEFSHYILNRGFVGKVFDYVLIYRKISVIALIMLCVLTIFACVCVNKQEDSKYKDDLYITSSGEHYHIKECIYIRNKTNVKRLTKEAYKSGDYTPCSVCLPDNE